MNEAPNNRVVHFEIQVDDEQRAIAFYKDVFGWEFTDYGPMEGYGGQHYWGVVTGKTGSGIDGGLHKRLMTKPAESDSANAFVATIVVPDYDATHTAIIAAGGRIGREKFALPGMAWQGYYSDTEGNIIGIHQPDENAQ